MHKNEATKLPEITVSGVENPKSPYNKSYQRVQSVSATRTDTPVMQTPFSVQAVPKQVFQDRQSVRVEDAIGNVSVVTPYTRSINDSTETMIWVFKTRAAYRNGILMPDNVTIEMANIQQIEVLKGPASVLYG